MLVESDVLLNPCSPTRVYIDGKMPKECGIKYREKVDTKVVLAGKSCKKHIENGEVSCGKCHAIKGDGKVCTQDAMSARHIFCKKYHLDFTGS